MHLINKITSATLLASILAACGGGGSTEPMTDPIVDPITDPITDPIVEPIIEPTTKAVSSLQVMYGKVADSNATPLANVTINIAFLNGEADPLLQLSAQTDINGNYEIRIPELKSETPLYVTANFLKEGFSEGEKALDISDKQISLSIDAMLSRVKSISVKRAALDALAFGADGQQRLQLSLVKTKDGKQQLLLGGAFVAEDVDTQLGLSIPSSSLPESIEVINGELAYFDSSDAHDIQSFPGEFIGAGETEQQGQGISFLKDTTDAEEYRLISSTFSQIKLTDQNGDAIELSDVQAADGSNPSITLQVPRGSYPTIEKDFDLSIDGIQIPIFVYKSSDGWQYVGNGLLVDALSSPVGPDYPEGSPVEVAQDGSLDLNGYNKNLYVLVEIIEANQWLKWINLDWPIKASTDVTAVCFNGSVDYNAGENYSGMTGVRLPDGGFEWIYIENGSFSLNSAFAISAEQAQDPANWEFSIRNAKTGQNETMVLPATIATGESCNEIAISLFNPYQCQLKGKAFAADGVTPIAQQTVTTLVNKVRATLITTEDGAYQQSIPCDESFSVSAFGQDKEQSVALADSPMTVDFSKANQPPILGVSSHGTGIVTEGETALVKWTVSDPEKDPVSVSITSCSYGENSCSWTENVSGATLTFPTHGHYALQISADDGTHTVMRELLIDVQKMGNQAPKINGFELNGQFYDGNANIDLVVGQQASLSVLASDINGDQLSFQWQGIECATNECDVDTSQAGEYPITLTVNDNNESEALSANANLTLVLAVDQPPEAKLLLSSDAVTKLNGASAQVISALLLASDDLTAQAQLTTIWSLTLDDEDYSQLLQADDTFNVHIEAGVLPVGEYQLTAQVTDLNIDNQSGHSISISTALLIIDDLPPTLLLTGSAKQLAATVSGAEQPLTVTATIADDLTPVEQLTVDWAISPEVSFSVSADNLTVTIAASELVVGDYKVTANLSDSQQQVSREYSFTVFQGNQAPTINGFELNGQFYDSNASIDLIVGQQASLSVLASDINGDPLSFQWQGIDCATTTNNNECVVDTSQPGEYPITLTVKDNNDSEALSANANLTLVLAVDQAPEAQLSLSNNAVIELNGVNAQAISASLVASDDLTAQAQLTTIWSLTLGDVDYSNALQVDDAFNVHIEAGALPVGEYQVTAQVTDINIDNEPGQSFSISKSLMVTDDLPPTLLITGSAKQLVATASGAELPLTVTATIGDDITPVEQLTVDWAISPALSFSVSADNLTVTIAASDLVVGDYKVTASLADSQQQVSSEYSFTVIKSNQAPTINGFELNGQFYDSNASIDLIVGQQASLSVLASDIDGDPLSFQWQGIDCAPTTNNNNNNNECVIDTSQPGEYPITLTVKDNNESEALSANANLTLILAVDQAPEAQLTLSSNAVIEQNGVNAQAINASLVASDDLTAQAQLTTIWSLTLGDEDYSDALQVDDAFNVHIEAGALPVGEYQVTAQVTDINIYNQSGQSISISNALMIIDDLPPTLLLTGTADQLVATASGAEQALTVTATIGDDLTPVEQLTVDWAISPELSFSVSADNLTVTIAASDLLVGDYKITASLADSQLQQVTSAYSFTVSQDQAPVISSMTVTPLSQVESAQQRNRLPISVLLAATDDFSEILDVEWQITPSVEFSASNSVLTIAAETIATGQYQVQAIVTDHRGQVSSKALSFEIKKRNGNVEIIID